MIGTANDPLGERPRRFDELHVVQRYEACNGVVVDGRATTHVSRFGASKATILGGGTVRFQYV